MKYSQEIEEDCSNPDQVTHQLKYSHEIEIDCPNPDQVTHQ